MADKNLKNINEDYPVLSGHDLLKKLEQTLPRPGMAKGYLPEKSSALQKCVPSLLEERLNTLQEEHVSRNRDLMQADWNPNKRIAYVLKCKGKVLQSAGEVINGRNVLYPEEVLFLMEISALELHFNGAMQSIQEAYRLLLGEEMALERFQVYSHLKRNGYIVVRHRKRSYDSSPIEHQRQAEPEPVYGESSGASAHVTQQTSQELQKYSDKNEYYTNDCIDEGKTNSKIENSDDVKLRSKNNQHFRCLWQGIDVPNIAGKAFLDLEIPSLHLFPKNAHPQKQHYIIDLSASKTEAELAFNPEDDYNQYHEHNACNSSNIMEYSENQTFPSGSRNYNVGETENLSSIQFKNVSQNVHAINQTEDQSNHNDVQSTSYENKKLGSFHNAELQQLPSNINEYINTQGCVHSIYGNQNDINKQMGENAYFNNMQTRTHNVLPSAEVYSFNMPYSEAGSSHIENCEQETSSYETNNSLFNNSYEVRKDNNHINRISAQNYENANVISLVNKVGEQLDSKDVISDYNCLYDSTSDPYEKSQKRNRNSRHHNNDSKNKDKNCYNDSSRRKSLPTKNTSRKQYYNRPLRKCKNNMDRNKRRKGRREEFSEDIPLFPRINKMVAGWDDFKREAELQSTAEHLMNGPARVLWNNNIIPLVAPSDHLTKGSVFGALSIIKNRNDTESCASQSPSYGKLDFDVYLPTVNYSRWDPGPPNHRIKVVRCKDPTPTIGYEDKIPVHYAMVDNGTITFYSFCNVKLPSYV